MHDNILKLFISCKICRTNISIDTEYFNKEKKFPWSSLYGKEYKKRWNRMVSLKTIWQLESRIQQDHWCVFPGEGLRKISNFMKLPFHKINSTNSLSSTSINPSSIDNVVAHGATILRKVKQKYWVDFSMSFIYIYATTKRELLPIFSDSPTL